MEGKERSKERRKGGEWNERMEGKERSKERRKEEE